MIDIVFLQTFKLRTGVKAFDIVGAVEKMTQKTDRPSFIMIDAVARQPP
jgi:hypothetical protein